PPREGAPRARARPGRAGRQLLARVPDPGQHHRGVCGAAPRLRLRRAPARGGEARPLDRGGGAEPRRPGLGFPPLRQAPGGGGVGEAGVGGRRRARARDAAAGGAARRGPRRGLRARARPRAAALSDRRDQGAHHPAQPHHQRGQVHGGGHGGAPDRAAGRGAAPRGPRHGTRHPRRGPGARLRALPAARRVVHPPARRRRPRPRALPAPRAHARRRRSDPERAGRRLDVRARAAGRGRRPGPVACSAAAGEPRLGGRLMGAALRVGSRHDTATPAAPPTPRPEAPCAAYARLAERVPGWARGPLGAWLWVAMEWLRSTLGTGMPWELLGHTQFRHLTVVQIADLGGVYAVSFVMALASVAGAELLGEGRAAARLRPWCARLALPAAVLLATAAYGAYARRLYAAPPEGRAVRTVAVVQGNIPNEFRWKQAFFERMLATYARLSAAAVHERPDVIVWPENAANFYLNREPLLLAELAPTAALAREGLVVGGPRLTDGGDARIAAYLIEPAGRVLGMV